MGLRREFAVVLVLFGLGGGGRALAQLDPADPWPKFQGDERNTGRAEDLVWVLDENEQPVQIVVPRRGPHALPSLRWWCSLGSVSSRTGGAAVGWIDGVRRVVVGTNDGKVLVFRFQPAFVDCTTLETAPDYSLQLPFGEMLESTPLILPDDQIVIQTTAALRSFRLTQACCFTTLCDELEPGSCIGQGGTPLGAGVHCSAGLCAGSPPTAPVWEWSVSMSGGGSSPTFGFASSIPEAPAFVYARADGRAYCVDPDPGLAASQRVVWVSEQFAVTSASDLNCPALGPSTELDGETEIPSADRILWVGFYNTTGTPDSFRKLVAINAERLPGLPANDPQPVAWASSLVEFNRNAQPPDPETCFLPPVSGIGCSTTLGAIASPVVLDSGRVLIVSDDGGVYSHFNRLLPDNSALRTPNLRYGKDGCQCISATPAVTAGGDAFFWREDDDDIQYVRDDGTDMHHRGVARINKGERWVFGAPILGSHSLLFFATPGQDSFPNALHWRSVGAWRYDPNIEPIPDEPPEGMAPLIHWLYSPPAELRKRFVAPLAMDADGTLIAVNDGFILALRPTLGDFNGDGQTDEDDASPLALALTAPATWEATLAVR